MLMNKIHLIVLYALLVTMPIKQKFGKSPKWMPTTFQRGAKVGQLRLKIVKCSVKPTTGRKEINRK
jgi:hypothetical protein